MKKQLQITLDYFYLLRPTLFFPGITIFLYGIKISRKVEFPIINLFVVILFSAIMYLSNEISDIKTDKINKKLFFLSENLISKKNALIFNYILIIIFSILLFQVNFNFLIIIGLAFLILIIFYNQKNINWKGKPIYSLLSSFIGGILFYEMGYCSSFIKFSMISILNALPFALSVSFVSLMTMILDEKGDKETGKLTFPVYFGVKKTYNLILVLNIITILSALYIHNIDILIVSILSLFLLVYKFKNNRILKMNVKISVFMLSLIISLSYPLYFIIIAIYFFLTRLYYKKRFGIRYP